MAARIVAAAAVLTLAAGASGAGRLREVERLPTYRKLVALTFDGGGDTANGTARILKTLRRRRVPATFFLAGRWIRLHPRLTRAIGRRYPIGDHTYDHADQTGLSSAEIRSIPRSISSSPSQSCIPDQCRSISSWAWTSWPHSAP